MIKVKNIDLSSFKLSSDSSVVVLDNHLLAFLDQLVAMSLAVSREVRINGPIDHDYTSTKLMQKLAKRIRVLSNHKSIGN
jgi:hypothetical protein